MKQGVPCPVLGLLLASRVVMMGTHPPRADGETGRDQYPLHPRMLFSSCPELGFPDALSDLTKEQTNSLLLGSHSGLGWPNLCRLFCLFFRVRRCARLCTSQHHPAAGALCSSIPVVCLVSQVWPISLLLFRTHLEPGGASVFLSVFLQCLVKPKLSPVAKGCVLKNPSRTCSLLWPAWTL